MCHRKYLFIVAAWTALAGSMGASAQSVDDILGPWNATINVAGQERNMQMIVTRQNGELGLLITTPQGDQSADNVAFENGTLSFSITFGPASLDIAVNVKGDTFSGQADSPFGPLDISGNKVSEAELAKAREQLEPLVGDWDTNTEYQDQRIDSKFRVELIDGRLMGSDMGGAQGPDAESFVPIRVQGDTLSWRIPIPYVTRRGARVEVTLDREAMKFAGTVRSSLGEIPISGEFVDTTKLVQTPYDNPEGVIGDWNLEVTLDGETTEATMTVLEKDERLHALLKSAAGDFESNSVAYDKIGETMGTLRITVDIPVVSEDELVFEFIVDGDTVEGEEIYNEGEFLISGTRVSAAPSEQKDAETAPAAGDVTAAMVMSMMDTDKDGNITLEEAPDQLKQFFTMVDADGSGGIDVGEAQTIADFMGGQGGN